MKIINLLVKIECEGNYLSAYACQQSADGEVRGCDLLKGKKILSKELAVKTIASMFKLTVENLDIKIIEPPVKRVAMLESKYKVNSATA